jgi:SWI/SNF-related matrix-associated actin-dependent regulator 1 of chromatin subfamily A
MTLEDNLKNYKGKNLYLNVLKDIVLRGESLSPSQIKIAEKFLFNHATKEEDLSLISSSEQIKEFNIDWEKYNHKSPFSFQKEAVNWLLNKDRAILGDDPGLGKSLTSIIAALESKSKKILVICPATLKLNWEREIKVFCDEVTIIDKEFNTSRFTIINYDILKKHIDNILKAKFDLVIADEAHFLKNYSSKRTRYVMRIANKTPKIWLLTGTPIANKPIDFYTLLKMCKHELGKNKQFFGERYCKGERTRWGWVFNGASNLRELHLKTKNIILRRKKEDVLDLPPKTRIPVYLELKNKKGYDRALADYYLNKYQDVLDEETLELLQEEKTLTDKLVEISVLRYFTALEKTQDGSLFELIDSYLEQGKKIVVFTNYLKVIDLIKEKYNSQCVTLDGRLSLEERQKNIDLFQNNSEVKLVACNLAIASVGLTLTAATVAIMNDLNWSPSVMIQAEDRIMRIGQTNAVDIVFPIYQGTIDENIFDVLQDKMINISQIIEGKIISYVNKDITSEIYSRLKNKP